MNNVKRLRIPWDTYESALLLEAVISIYIGGKSKKATVLGLSNSLRQKAISSGIQIDDYYRNANGVELQLQKMAYWVTNGMYGMPGAAKIFIEVANLYHEKPEEYKEILWEAKRMIGNEKSNKTMFFEWLATQVTAAQLSELYMSYDEISEFCQSRNLIKNPLFEITDIAKLAIVRNTVESNKVFRMQHKRSLSKMSSAIRFYISYIKENREIFEKQDDSYIRTVQQSQQKQDTDLLSQSPKENNSENTKLATNDTNRQKEQRTSAITVDLSELREYAFTSPVQYEYFGDVYHVRNWKDLYVSCCKTLWEDYPERLLQLSSGSNAGSVWFCRADELQKYNIRTPKEIIDGFVTETNLSATDLMRKLRTLVEYCNVDYENLLITFVKRSYSETTDTIKPVLHRMTGDSEREAFSEWMSKNEMKPNTILNYLSALNQVQDFLHTQNIYDGSLYAIASTSALENVFTQLLNNHEFIKWNSDQHNRFRAALSKYIAYRSSSYVDGKENTSIQQVVEKSVMPNEDIVQRYSKILETDFPDGLRPMVIHLDKFKQLYQKEYGESLELDNDILRKKLEMVGTLIDGRIFAKKSAEDTAILETIQKQIADTFESGASCIFLECLMEQYGQQLANDLGIYNEDALASMLLSNNQNMYHRRNGFIQQGFGVPDFAQDVLRVMQDSHDPMNYAELKMKLWYLPIDKIKHVLVTEQAVVNVDTETYFYAPNLPITKEELSALTSAMHQQIAEKGFLVAKDFPVLLEEVAPAAAVNTYEFKDWALRNVFGYILCDEFSFSRSLVCEKGQIIDIGQAYRNYCMQFERISLDDLKEFSDEVGVQIYWNDVLKEMIRVSPTELVRKDLIHFNVDAMDALLDTFCPGDYIPIKDIGLFLHFPATDVAWNGFVLESYLLNFSKNFSLYQASIAESDYFGVIVRNNAGFLSYTDVIVDMWAHSKEWTDKKSALELLVQHGCQARRHLGNIDVLLKEAALKREQIEKEQERG